MISDKKRIILLTGLLKNSFLQKEVLPTINVREARKLLDKETNDQLTDKEVKAGMVDLAKELTK